MTQRRFPVILLCLTLVLALLVTGFGVPGFFVPLLTGKQQEEGLELDPMAEGHSKAFEITPVPGVTISAEKNALDRNRKFKMEDLPEEKADAYQEAILEEVPFAYVMDAWHLDAGLADDELLPGTFQMQFDLAELGVAPEDYAYYTVYRVDDAGTWYEYAGGLDGSVYTIESNQNCDIIGCLIAFAILAPPAVDAMLKFQSGGYFKWSTRSVEVPIDGKTRYSIVLDYENVVNLLEMADNGVGKDLIEKVRKRCEDEKRRMFGKTTKLTEKQRREFNSLGLYSKFLKEYADKDPDVQRLRQEMAVNTREIERHYIDKLQPLETISGMLQKAHKYLSSEVGMQMPTHVVRVEVFTANDADQKMQGKEGITISPFFGHPYMVIPIKAIGSHYDNDKLLLTITHEMFHISQRTYVFKTRANDKFDEMTAQSLELDAFEYYEIQGDVTTTSEEDMSRHFNSANAYKDYALELDAYSTKYPEGKYSPENKTLCCYPFGRFIHYLMEENSMSYPRMMIRYKSLLGHREVTTIVKYVFDLTDEELTEQYHDFTLKNQAHFYADAKGTLIDGEGCYSPFDILSPERVIVKEYKHNYTTRVRRIAVCPRNKEDKRYAVLLAKDDGFDDVCGDIAFTPIDMEEGEDYKKLDSGQILGLFITEKEMKNAGKVGTIEGMKPDFFLMESDGGSTGNGWFSGSESKYSLYTLYPLQEPDWKIDGTELQVKLPKIDSLSDHRGLTDSYVITLRIGKTQIFREQVLFTALEKKPDEPWKCDLDKLKLNGSKLTAEQRESLIMDVQECVTGTYETDPCLGPSDPIELEGVLDIFGTWDIESKMNTMDHNYMDGILDAMPEEMQEYYKNALQGVNGQTSPGVMTVTRLADGTIEAQIQYETEGAPLQVYAVELDAKARTMTLTPKQQMLMDPMVMRISGSGSELSFACDMKYQSGIVDYDAELSGTKRIEPDLNGAP